MVQPTENFFKKSFKDQSISNFSLEPRKDIKINSAGKRLASLITSNLSCLIVARKLTLRRLLHVLIRMVPASLIIL